MVRQKIDNILIDLAFVSRKDTPVVMGVTALTSGILWRLSNYFLIVVIPLAVTVVYCYFCKVPNIQVKTNLIQQDRSDEIDQNDVYTVTDLPVVLSTEFDIPEKYDRTPEVSVKTDTFRTTASSYPSGKVHFNPANATFVGNGQIEAFDSMVHLKKEDGYDSISGGEYTVIFKDKRASKNVKKLRIDCQ